MIVAGGVLTHNCIDDVGRAVASLRSVSDVVLAFDDGSTDGTVDALRKSSDFLMTYPNPEPRLVLLRRSLLYAEAEKIGADWFVYHDDDEALSPSAMAGLRGVLDGLHEDRRVLSVNAAVVNYWGDMRHRLVECSYLDENIMREVVAWRCNAGFNYYEALVTVFRAWDSDVGWHAHRAPIGMFVREKTVGLSWPDAALLHYANSTPERTAARLRWSSGTGLHNGRDFKPASGEIPVIEIEENPPWMKP